jgi:hypothetical protein
MALESDLDSEPRSLRNLDPPPPASLLAGLGLDDLNLQMPDLGRSSGYSPTKMQIFYGWGNVDLCKGSKRLAS